MARVAGDLEDDAVAKIVLEGFSQGCDRLPDCRRTRAHVEVLGGARTDLTHAQRLRTFEHEFPRRARRCGLAAG